MVMATACVLAAAALVEVDSVSASASAFAAAAMVVADLAAAAAAVVVVAAESAALAAADWAVPSPDGPRSALSREPKSWLRDSSLGRAPRLRPRPSLHSRLRIPEPRCPQPDLSLVDFEPECHRAEAVSESLEGPGQLTR